MFRPWLTDGGRALEGYPWLRWRCGRLRIPTSIAYSK